MDIPIKDFQRLFYVAYCITVHKSQGETYNEPYTIHEFERFDGRLKYVALSRATDFRLINILGKPSSTETPRESQERLKVLVDQTEQLVATS